MTEGVFSGMQTRHFHRFDENLRALLDSLPDAKVLVNPLRRVLFVNQRAEELLAVDRKDFIGSPAADFISLAFRRRYEELIASCLGDALHRSAFEWDARALRKDGSEFPAEISMGRLETDRGPIAILSLRDVTSRKVAEEQFRRLLETAPDAQLLVNSERNIIYVNAQAENMFGYSRNDLLGQSVQILIPERYRAQHATFTSEYFSRPHVRPIRRGYELYGLRRDGTEFRTEISLTPLETAAGTVVAVAVRDITERIQAEERLLQHQADLAHVARLNIMGEMAAGIAHELNQPLYAIVNYARACERLLSGRRARPAELRKISDKLVAQTERAAEIIRRLRRFVSRREASRTLVDINALVRNVEQLMTFHASRHAISVRRELSPGLPMVRADAIQIEQVLVNLLRNAFEAMSEPATVARDLGEAPLPIELTSPIPGKHSVVTVRTEIRDDGMVEVSVSDTGPGFSAESGCHLFETFYTTKAQGMGLGLPISRTIAEGHGGSLEAELNPQGGATFRLALPPAGDEPEEDSVPVLASQAP